MTVRNLLDGIPEGSFGEWSEILAGGGEARIERIVSRRGHSSPEGFWYDQRDWEWVMVLTGRAKVRFEGDHGTVCLGPGDHITIPPRTRHRVEWTDPEAETVWLAVHYCMQTG